MYSFLKRFNVERWESFGSNADQNYLTHSIFRYFGKLPPEVTSKILKTFLPRNQINNSLLVLDLMCGSGTTLVEAQSLGVRSIGIDSNELSVLISKVKTTQVQLSKLRKAIEDFISSFSTLLRDKEIIKLSSFKREIKKSSKKYPCCRNFIPQFKNINKWFSHETKLSLSICKNWIEKFNDDKELYDCLFLCWLSIIRLCSNASVRTGRIFLDKNKKNQNPFYHYVKKLISTEKIFSAIPKSHFRLKPELYVGDARTVALPKSIKADFSFFHPPYFALYKYSSDVLRFELEWGDFNRKSIAKREITDGFKTSNADLLNQYVVDILSCIKSGLYYTKKGRWLVIVIGNSTLSEKQLPVVDRLLEACEKEEIRCNRIIERQISYSQALYHKSANPNIKSSSDYILAFKIN